MHSEYKDSSVCTTARLQATWFNSRRRQDVSLLAQSLGRLWYTRAPYSNFTRGKGAEVQDLTLNLSTKWINTLRTGNADLRFYVTTVQDGWRRFTFLTRWNSVHLQVLLSSTPQVGMFPEVSHPQALIGSLVSISWKFQFTKIVSEFVINF